MSSTESVPKARVEVRQSANGRRNYAVITCLPGSRGFYDGPSLGFGTRVTVHLNKGSLLILPPEDDDFVIERVRGPRGSILDIHGTRVTIKGCDKDVVLAWKGREAGLVGDRLEFRSDGLPIQTTPPELVK